MPDSLLFAALVLGSSSMPCFAPDGFPADWFNPVLDSESPF
jgi:hypothetical protein